MATLSLTPEEERLLERQLEARRIELASAAARYTAGAGGATAVILALVFLSFQQYAQILGFAVLAALAAGSAVLLLVLQRRGQARLGIYVLLATIWLAITLVPLLVPEILDAAAIGYTFLIVLGNILLGEKGGRVVTAAAVVAFIADAWLVNVIPRWFMPLDIQTSKIINLISSSVVPLAVGLTVGNIVKGQDALFRKSQGANLIIEKQMAAERQQREHLQTTINHYVDYMAQVRQGDLTARLSFDGQETGVGDPLLMLGRNLNDMTGSLQLMIIQIREAATNLGSAAAEILAATTQQVAGASEQSAAISQTTTTVDEVKTISEQAILRLQEVANAAQRTVEVSRSGQRTVQDLIDGMSQIKERVEGIAENILALSEQTQQIGEIIATVGDLAAQSNILALNASIEAARAGENGKSFGVVAVEVRNLAEQSRQATAQVRAILSEIQQATNAAVMATEEGTKEVDRRIQQAAEARLAIEQLSAVITESAQTAVQVVAGGRQQATGVEQIAVAMQNINQATVQSLSSTRQTERAAQNMNQLAGELTTTVGQYQS